MTQKKKIEFFIDTYREAAHRHIMETISAFNDSDVDDSYHIRVMSIHEEDANTHYFHLVGTWEAYRLFLRTPNVDLNLPKNDKYHYSLTHYED